jgi:hypothetical protein
MNQIFQPEKTLWTDVDFEQMNWHDCPIKAIAFNDHQLLLDIDYIFKWVLMRNKKRYQFWISPCTLMFENVHAIELSSDYATLTIDNISRANPVVPKNAAHIGRDYEFDWVIETIVGEISFKSVGYKQYVRQNPVLVTTQELAANARGGISFSTTNVEFNN